MTTCFQRLCAWLWKNETFRYCVHHYTIPEWIGELVTNTISEHTWNDGYLTACVELEGNCPKAFDVLSRLSATHSSRFHPCWPILLSRDLMFLDDWNAGYERAVLLWRLGIYPESLLKINHILTQRTSLPQLECLISTVIDGDLKVDPRIWVTRTGQCLSVRQSYQSAVYEVYKAYAEKYQQVRAAHLLLVEKECQYCANSIDECTCKEVTKTCDRE